MALADGIRRNVATISQEERDLLRDAIAELNQDPQRYPGGRDDIPLAGGVTFWFKQDEIHQATHVHGGPAFYLGIGSSATDLKRCYEESIPGFRCTTGTGRLILTTSSRPTLWARPTEMQESPG